MRLPGTVRILRPGNAAMTALAVLAGAIVASGFPALASWRVAVAALAAFAFAGAGNVANDLRDVALDARAHPERPLVTGEVAPRAARRIVIALYALAVAGAAAIALAWLAAGAPVALGLAPVALVAAALAVMEAYERRLKATGLPGNVAVAVLTGAPFVLGALAASAWPGAAVLVLAGLATLATLGREILKDVEDAEADAGAGRRTLAHRVGPGRAAAGGVAALVAAVALSPVPAREGFLGSLYVPVVVLADGGFLAAAGLALAPASLDAARRAGRAQRAAKAAMLVALVAFLAGRLG